MHRVLVAVAVVTASVMGVTGVVTPTVAAASDDPVLEDVFSSDSPTETAESLLKAAWASRKRAAFTVQNWLPDFVTESVPSLAPDRQTAEEELAGVASFYNTHNATFEAYINDRTTITENGTVKIALHLHGGTATRYLEVNATDGNITDSSVVSSTDRDITETIEVCGFAADQSLEELQRFEAEFAEPNKDVTRDYLAELAGKYGGDVESTLITTRGTCGSDS